MIDQNYLEKHLLPLLLSRGKEYEKWKPVKATKVTSRKPIRTITSSGLETENIAEKGDYIVQNMTVAEEEYVVPGDKFIKLYERKETIDENTALYIPKGRVLAIAVDDHFIEVFQVTTPFEIRAPWGTPQIIRLGDYLVTPMGHHEYYGIGKQEFHETYRLSKKDNK